VGSSCGLGGLGGAMGKILLEDAVLGGGVGALAGGFFLCGGGVGGVAREVASKVAGL